MPHHDAPTSERTLLLVSALFPPWMEVGAARWEGFAPYVTAAGWRLDVLMQRPPAGTKVDQGRVDKLGPKVSTTMIEKHDPAWREPILQAASALRGRRRVVEPESSETTTTAGALNTSEIGALHPRELFTTAVRSSRERRWIREVLESSRRFAGAAKGSVVISSGPPHDAHVAASAVARSLGLPHVLDLRDPWVGNPEDRRAFGALFRSPIDAAAEERVIGAAAAVIANTPAAAAVLTERHPRLRGRVHAILNGTDRPPAPARVLDPAADYMIVHTGTLYLDRDPRPFFRAVAASRQRLGTLGPRVKVVFMGHKSIVAGRPLAEWVAEYGIGDCFEERPFGTRDAAVQLMSNAAMLVAFQGATPTQVPAKVFDYASNASTLLALTDPVSATASILAGTTARVAALDNEDAITAHLTDAVQRAYAGEPITSVDADGRFARSRQAEALLRLLDTL